MTTIANPHLRKTVRAAQEAEIRRGPRADAHAAGPHGLTRQEARTVRTIQALTAPDGVAPSYREIGAAVGVSHTRIARVVEQLEAKGWLAPRRAGSWRGLRLLQRLDDASRADAIGAALEHQSWGYGQGIGLFRMLEICGIEAPETLTEAEAAGLLADHYAGLREILQSKEVGNG